MGFSRRNAIIGLGGLIAGGGALVGTGAFTTVQAERTVAVETAADANALLSLEPAQDQNEEEYPNAQEYVTSDGSNGTLEITVPDVNLNAITKIDRVFQIKNNGTRDVVIYLEEILDDDDTYATSTDFGVLAEELTNPEEQEELQYPILGDDRVSISSSTPPDGAAGYGELGVLLGVGESIEVGIYIDTSDNDIGSGFNETSRLGEPGANEVLLEEVIIHASATEAENGNYRFEAKAN